MRQLKLMADYGCFPLWETTGGIVNLDPECLPISAPLCAQLTDWAAMYDATLNLEDPTASGFESPQDEQAFRRQAIELGNQLRSELGAHFTLSVVP